MSQTLTSLADKNKPIIKLIFRRKKNKTTKYTKFNVIIWTGNKGKKKKGKKSNTLENYLLNILE